MVESILVVDDSPLQRAHAVSLCHALGVPLVYEASGGAEALDLLGLLRLAPQVLMVDLEMPGMDGVELIGQLHRRGFVMPLIVASGRERSLIHSVEAMARNLGMPVVSGLRKPLQLEPLGLLLREIPGKVAAGTAPQAGPAEAISAQALADAIQRGEIGVHYQPKVDMRTGIVRGVEALARWQRPGLGFERPDRFIPVAEHEGLIHGLTLAVLRQALAQAEDWNARGLRLSMAVNLSPHLLDRPALVEEILALVAERHLQPEQLVLEITETSVVKYLGTALGVLARLRLKGFGLSIDDYGTGFSSMQQLARVPFTELKIDRSFVHGAHQRSDLCVMLRSALDMARQLELVTVAEGIETLEDWRLLQEFGCVIGQGYLIARPMAAKDLPRWLKRHQLQLPRLQAGAAAVRS